MIRLNRSLFHEDTVYDLFTAMLNVLGSFIYTMNANSADEAAVYMLEFSILFYHKYPEPLSSTSTPCQDCY